MKMLGESGGLGFSVSLSSLSLLLRLFLELSAELLLSGGLVLELLFLDDPQLLFLMVPSSSADLLSDRSLNSRFF